MMRSFTVGVLSLGLIGAANAQEPKATSVRDEAQQTPAEKAKVALQKLAEAQKAAAAAAAKAREAAVQALTIRTASRGGPERDTVDPQDPIERFALFTGGGPLIVQASLTIDGQPFRIGREKLLAEMIAVADADKDGQTTWTEAMSTSRFTLGRFGNLNDQLRRSIISTLDKNKNNLVETSEARQFLAQFSQGTTFLLGGGPTSFRVVAGGALQPTLPEHADLLKLLDTDSSKSLDAKELAAATTRLKSRDADDNDVLDEGEVTGDSTSSTYRVAAVGPVQTATGALLLGPTATQDAVFAALRDKYKNANGKLTVECFPLFLQLFAALDKDQSGEIESREVLGLNEVSPHIELNVDLATQKVGGGLMITSLTADIYNADDDREKKVLELPGVRITLAASLAAPPMRNFDSSAKALLNQFDKDANGYLDKLELPPLPGQFEMYDENGDGKAYLAEIAAGYARQAAPQLTQVVTNIVQKGNSLFQTLDSNGDGRLGLREMRAATERLAALDKDHNQIIGGNEIPEAISVSFSLGSSNNAIVGRPVPYGGGRPAANAGPEWFTRMDRNGDGDVTLKEFLGSEDDFKRLDASGDGLLDPQEAKAAGK